MRLGQSQTRAFISGVFGVPAGAGVTDVRINAFGQLYSVSSSRRFKEDIEDMANLSSGILQLRPVTFRYKKEHVRGPRTMQFGLIAEEVAEVYPELVVHDKDGKIYSVAYSKLTTMLLNELQKEHRVNMTQAEKIHAQQEMMLVQAQELTKVQAQLTIVQTQYQQLQNLTARLAKLEAHSNTIPVNFH